MQFLKIIFRKTKNAKMNLRTNSEPIMMWSGADATKAGHTCTSMYCILLHLLLLCQLGFKAEIQIIFRTVQAEETEVVILCRL